MDIEFTIENISLEQNVIDIVVCCPSLTEGIIHINMNPQRFAKMTEVELEYEIYGIVRGKVESQQLDKDILKAKVDSIKSRINTYNEKIKYKL